MKFIFIVKLKLTKSYEYYVILKLINFNSIITILINYIL